MPQFPDLTVSRLVLLAMALFFIAYALENMNSHPFRASRGTTPAGSVLTADRIHRIVTAVFPQIKTARPLPGMLNNRMQSVLGGIRTGTKPITPPAFSGKNAEEQIATLDAFLSHGLRRIMTELANLRLPADAGAVSTRQIANAYAQFRATVVKTIERGPDFVKDKVFLKMSYYWIQTHPTLSCTHIPRMGHEEDGSKFVCNAEALIDSAEDKEVRIVGVGSNKNYAWEEECLATFGEKNVRQIDIYDCTVKGAVTLPRKTVFHRECVGAKKELIRWSEGKMDMSIDTIPFYETLSERHGNIDLLKVDAEGYENHMIGQWVTRLIEGSHEQTLTVKQFQMEVHRAFQGWPPPAVTHDALLGLIALFMHLYAIGMVPVYYEANPYASCCYEYVLVNASWWAQSEVVIKDLWRAQA